MQNTSATQTRKQRRRGQRALRKNEPARGETLARLLPWLAVALAVLAYAGALSYPFVYDDIMLVGNQRLTWEYLPQYFLHNIWSQPGKEIIANYYRPMNQLWVMLNHEWFGDDPAGYHATGMAMHALATLLVYLLAARTLKNRAAAGFAALFFAVHPLHVEAVAWISGVNESEFCVFFLAAMLFYLRWREGKFRFSNTAVSQGRDTGDKLAKSMAGLDERGARGLPPVSKWYVLSLVSYLSSILTKETAIVLCPLVFVYECLGARNKRFLRAIWVTLPYAGLTAAYLGVRAVVLKGLAPSIGSPVSHRSILYTMPGILWFYVRKLLWPLPVSLFYPARFLLHFSAITIVWPLLASAAAFAGLWIWSRRNPTAAISSAWVLLPLGPPVLAISRFPNFDLIHDRYLYLPSVGLVMLMALALRELKPDVRRIGGVPLAQLCLGLVITCALAAITMRQAEYWSSDLAVYGHAVEVAPNNPFALNWLATVTRRDKNDLKTALQLAERALAVDPNSYEGLVEAGRLRWGFHNYDGALSALLHARELHNDRHEVYFWLGATYLEKNQFLAAEAAFRQAIQLEAHEPEQHVGLGMALEDEGRLPEARAEYQAELRIFPKSASATKRLAVVDAELKNSH